MTAPQRENEESKDLGPLSRSEGESDATDRKDDVNHLSKPSNAATKNPSSTEFKNSDRTVQLPLMY